MIPKLAKYINDSQAGSERLSFQQIVEAVVQHLEGAFALLFKSALFPNELVATRRGSPLLIGIKSSQPLAAEHVTVQLTHDPKNYAPGDLARSITAAVMPRHINGAESSDALPCSGAEANSKPDAADELGACVGARLRTASNSSNMIANSDGAAEIEYFLASDASAIIEHTNRVIYLEDEDVAYINHCGGEQDVLALPSLRCRIIVPLILRTRRGCVDLFIHRMARTDEPANQIRAIRTLEIELQQIMKGALLTGYDRATGGQRNFACEQGAIRPSCRRRYSNSRIASTTRCGAV